MGTYSFIKNFKEITFETEVGCAGNAVCNVTYQTKYKLLKVFNDIEGKIIICVEAI